MRGDERREERRERREEERGERREERGEGRHDFSLLFIVKTKRVFILP